MPSRHTPDLQHYRQSVTGTLYFLTCCTEQRKLGLTDSGVTDGLIMTVKHSDVRGDTLTYGLTVMPDHLHWVFRLGERLALGQIVAKFKSLTRAALATHQLEWQRNYYEHQLRPAETPEDYCLYAFLNPYRAMLLPSDQLWPGWWTGAPSALQFIGLLNPNGSPPAEWVENPIPSGLSLGE